MDEILTIKDIAIELNVAEQTVRQWCKRGVYGIKLENVCIGDRFRITRRQLQNFLDLVKKKKIG